MNLYLLRRIEHPGCSYYDCNDGAVIRAESKEKARHLAFSVLRGDEGPEVWLYPQTSTCDEISTDGPECVVLIDFHAG